MDIKIPKKLIDHIVHESNLRESGYNSAWLDGYRNLAVQLGIVEWSNKKNKYVKKETRNV